MKRAALSLTLLLLAILASVAAYRLMLSDSPEKDSSSVAGIHSRIAVPAVAPDGTPITQLSALAWDKDEQLLYALSDRGTLFHFRLTWEGNALRTAEPVYAAPIVTDGVMEASGRGIDTEDMVLVNHDNGRKGDSELFVVMEREPRFLHLKPSGAAQRVMAVPAPLNDVSNFQKANQGLEALVMHPQHGLLTTPEAPLRAAPADMHTLHGNERTWMFKRYSEDARLKAMALLDNGDVLVLERSRSPTPKYMIASLRQLSLDACETGQECTVTEKLVLPEERSNFEGLTHIKDNQFLMVNDHNGKDGQGGTLLLVTIPSD